MENKLNIVWSVFTAVLVLLDCILLIWDTFYILPVSTSNAIINFDLCLCSILFVEYVYRLYKSDNRKKFLRENIFELIAIIPFDFFLLRFFRFVRIIRLLKVARVVLLFSKDLKFVFKFLKRTYLDKIFIIVFIFVALTSFLLYEFDSGFTSLFSSFWYVIVTLTTVGYGDFIPTSFGGKIIGSVLLIFGVFCFSILTGAISSIYTKNLIKTEDSDIVQSNGYLEDDLIRLNERVDKLSIALEENSKKDRELEKKLDVINDKLDKLISQN